MPVFYLNMKYETTIEPPDAHKHLEDRSWVFIDCRFFLREPDRGEREYLESHITGAVYAHLDRDLTGPVVPGRTGRHPLPPPDALSGAFRRLGIGPSTQVVAYDASNGSMAAARLWWMLKWAGHDAAAVLDGGLAKWRSLGLPCAGGLESRPQGSFIGRFRPELVLSAEEVLSVLDDPRFVVLDSRAAERYQGLNETLDPVAGHIRGALSAPYLENVTDDGSFKPAEELARRFNGLTAGRDAGHTVFYCGSGVTAAHNILCCARAGMGMARLYAGSWSEWITDTRRPMAAGPS